VNRDKGRSGMANLPSRRCLRPGDQVSTIEKLIGGVILLVLVALGGALAASFLMHGGTDRPTPAASATSRSAEPVTASTAAKAFDLPRLDVSGWTGPHQVQTYTPETVHQKINGRDGLYLAFGIVGMTFGNYKHSGREDRYVDVYVYDMGGVFNAFGCYRTEYAENMPAVALGRGGYRAERSVFYWKGHSYVQLVAGDGVTPEDDPHIAGLASQIAAGITDDGLALWGDDVLPKTNRKPNGLGYERINAFSLDFLGDVFRADYVEGQAQYAMFIHRAADAQAARRVLDQYATYLSKHGKVVSREDSPGGQTMVGEATGMYDVIFCKDRYLGGVNGAENQALARQRAAAFRDGLKTTVVTATGPSTPPK